jgi:cytochrome c5
VSATNDSAFLRMFLYILGALVAFTAIILILANVITDSAEEARGPDPRLRAAIVERIKPVGSVQVAAAQPVVAAPKSGAEVVAMACNSCHQAGVLGAPKTGDTAAWEARLAAEGGVDGLTTSAINGKGGMPPRGGAQVSDAEIRAAVVHLLSESGVDVDAAATASAPAAAAEQSGLVEDVKQMADDAVEAVETVADAAGAMVSSMMPAPAAEAPTAAAAPAAAPVDLARGESVYKTACFACHATGAAGAPLLGNQAQWAPRIGQGMEALYRNSINGKGAMPPKGGRLDLSDGDVKAAVAYMVEQVK